MNERDQRVELVPFCYPNLNRKTYSPVRSVQADIFQVSTPMVEFPLSEWAPIEGKIRSKSRGPMQAAMNVYAGKALFNGLRGRNAVSNFDPEITRSISFGEGRAFSHWLPYLAKFDTTKSAGVVPVVDFRVRGGLSLDTYKFVFSMMNLAIREPAPEYEKAEFVIIKLPLKFPKSKKFKDRGMSIHDDNGEYFTFDELEEMISTTYRLYEEVFADELRRAA
ncbi:hypothetical protein [Mesorhizobium australafricanum]|uniref:Uncharacterized protein n=1 Tax=Mesorhizobium australafricanum TaxID=3072311 RepID=A0ABU4X3F5_9HYPH|nr:hypothetical protein [Mesorhizobium sp. VK3E]MDX8442828.1 hypothetical protein [Mesorhizobium sp. VK3E]